MVYRIALYNLNQHDQEIVTALLERYQNYTDTSLSISNFKSGFDLNNTDQTFHVAFVDLSTHRESSLKIAQEFLRKNSWARLVVLSTSISHYQDGFRIGAERFFTKPIKDDHFFTEMESVFNHISYHLSSIRIDESKEEWVSIDAIMYAETENRRVKFYTTEGLLYSRETFAYWHDYFEDSNLILCSRGCLVNLRYIKEIQQTTILLTTGTLIPVSRRMRTKVVKRFMRYQNL